MEVILAVSALDVAFVSALATVAAAVVLPVSSWLISKQTREHELKIDRERRLFEARRELYASVLADVFRSVGRSNVQEIILRDVDPGVELQMPTGSGVEDFLDLQARIAAIAPEQVMDALDQLFDLHEKFWRLSVRLTAERAKSESSEIPTSDKEDVAALAKKLRSARGRVAKEMRVDLSGTR